MIASLI